MLLALRLFAVESAPAGALVGGLIGASHAAYDVYNHPLGSQKDMDADSRKLRDVSENMRSPHMRYLLSSSAEPAPADIRQIERVAVPVFTGVGYGVFWYIAVPILAYAVVRSLHVEVKKSTE